MCRRDGNMDDEKNDLKVREVREFRDPVGTTTTSEVTVIQNGIGEVRKKIYVLEPEPGMEPIIENIIIRVQDYAKGLKPENLIKPDKDELLNARIWQLHFEGKTIKQIATIVKFSESTVKRRLRAKGLTKPRN